ncbi:unnamed protein product [Rotaria sp. Silwood2]|nr:unnamed protein product [Rotaria sp. Silwood2]
MNINVKKQIVTLELNNQRITVPIINTIKSIKIPVVSSNTVLLPLHSIQTTSVAIPISSISLPFVPLSSSLKHYKFIRDKNKALDFQNCHSTILVSNSKKNLEIIRKGACLGYLLCSSLLQRPRIFYSSLYKSLGATRRTGMIPASSDFLTDKSSNDCSVSSCHTIIQLRQDFQKSVSNVTQLVVDVTLKTIHSLVDKIQDRQQKQNLLLLFMHFRGIFDTTKHNIARTPIPHVISTVPHSPPASRPYPQRGKEEAMYQLIQEFLHVGLIVESNSPYAASAILVKKKIILLDWWLIINDLMP